MSDSSCLSYVYHCRLHRNCNIAASPSLLVLIGMCCQFCLSDRMLFQCIGIVKKYFSSELVDQYYIMVLARGTYCYSSSL